MKERDFVTKILKYLNGLPGCKAIKVHGNIYMEVGTPDILGSYKGRMLAIEVKKDTTKPTPIQLRRIQEWHEAGAYTAVLFGIEGLEFLKNDFEKFKDFEKLKQF